MKLIKRFSFLSKYLVSSKEEKWLLRNKLERMDAYRKDLFVENRAEFHLERYKFASKIIEKGKILDLGCGTGYGTDFLSNAHFSNLCFGIDVNIKSIKYCNRHYPSEHVSFIVADGLYMPFGDRSFDAVVCFETIEHFNSPVAVLEEIRRVLKIGGIAIISTPNDWNQFSSNKFHFQNFNYFTFRELLARYFSVAEIYNHNSGMTGRDENRNQPKGIVPSTNKNSIFAECYIAIIINST